MVFPNFAISHQQLTIEYEWSAVELRFNVMAHTQKPDFVFRRKG
jgi:hypothetical protein